MNYERKKARLIADIQRAKEIALGKSTSNVFRHRKQDAPKIDVRDFNNVLHIDTKKLVATVEGMTTYATLVDETLKKGLLPTVVPELKSITIGGAATGLGIESSSFKYGLVHETIQEMEILLGDGSVVTCSPKKNSDLFFGFPNSYGTLGYALKIKVKLVKAKKYVKVEHRCFTDAQSYFNALEKICKNKNNAFVDGTIFNEHEMYITLGVFTDHAPFVSDYTNNKIYYTSIKKKKTDYLTAKDYIWRWDTDWFWCSKHMLVQNPVIRFLTPKQFLNSITYWKIRNIAHKSGLTKLFRRTESIVQDVEIPIEHCAEFIEFFHKEIGIKPVWACPTQVYNPKHKNPLYVMTPRKLYVNFGFWDVKRSDKPAGYYNKRIEAMVEKLKGKKSLYSDAYYSKEKFWQLYNKKAYDRLKKKYDPRMKLKDLYAKVVRKS